MEEDPDTMGTIPEKKKRGWGERGGQSSLMEKD